MTEGSKYSRKINHLKDEFGAVRRHLYHLNTKIPCKMLTIQIVVTQYNCKHVSAYFCDVPVCDEATLAEQRKDCNFNSFWDEIFNDLL